MRKFAKAGAVIVTIGILMLIVGLLTGGAKPVSFANWQPKIMTRSSKNYNVDQFKSIKINVNNLNVEVVRGDKYDVRYLAGKTTGLSVAVINNVLEVSQKNSKQEASFGFNFIGDTDFKIQITVPNDVDLANVQVNSGNADIKLSDLVVKNLSLVTSSGDINLTRNDISGNATVKSNDGDVDIHSSNIVNPIFKILDGDISVYKSELANSYFELHDGDFLGDANKFSGSNVVRNLDGDNTIIRADRKLGYRVTTQDGDNTLFDQNGEDNTLSHNWHNQNKIELISINSDNDVN